MSSRCRVLYTIMTYLTLTTYCWMLCEGIHIFICLEYPLQVAQNGGCKNDSFEFSNYLEGCKIAYSESGVLFMILIVRNCALIFLPQQVVLLSSWFLYLRRRSNPSSFLLLGRNVFSPQNFPVFS